MSNINKTRISDVAKDFDVRNKVVMQILSDHGEVPKSPAKVLEDSELNLIFNEITKMNEVSDIEEALSKTRIAEQDAPAAVETSVPAQAEAEKESAKPAEAAQPTGEQPKTAEAPKEPAKPKKPERRYVDTRNSNVDMSKYDEHVDDMVPEKAANAGSGKQKIKKAADKKPSNFSQKRRLEEQEKMRRLQQEVRKKQPIKVSIPDEISVGELASRLKKTGAEVVKQLVKLGVMAAVSDVIDFDTASLVAMEFGAKIEHEIHRTIEERLFADVDHVDDASELVPRDPVVVVMGHVDHGKTSLLDAIRKTHVVAGEAGGITQHIGAYQIKANGRVITFLDTPGHAAFTSMRARGASVTDVAILVVAADDGVMPQTIEAINHAKAANVPIIVAVNKMDKPSADPDRVLRQLTEHDLLPEEWGGDTVICKVSATNGTGLPELLEMVLLVSDMQELKANPNREASGAVIEARLDKNRGAVATLLVQNGTLHVGDLVIAGTSVGRVRAMTNDKGQKINAAGPSMPVEIIGLDEAPGAGDHFRVAGDERMARELVEERKQKERDASATAAQKMSLQDLFANIQDGSVKDLNIILKADVQGSAEALKASLEELSNEEVRVRIIHTGVGAINENDIMLAYASSAIVIGFNVRPDINTRMSAEQKGIDMRMYRVIYECIDEVKAAIKGMLAPKFREEILGTAEVRQVFKVTGAGTIAGCMVKDGKVQRSAKVRLVRDGVVIHEGEISSLKRFKDDAREVATGFECGISLERFSDIKEGDIIENFLMVQI